MTSAKRTAVLRDVARMSYTLVGERHGLTRNQVAGIVFRHKNPQSTMIFKTTAGNRCGGKNGRGHHGPGEYAPLTLPPGRHNKREAA